MEFFLKGLIVGFVIASPIGPVGILGIRRTLAEGRLIGLFTVLGTAAADAIYGMIAALGMTAVSHELVAHRSIFRLISGLFLLYLGWTTFRARPRGGGARPEKTPTNLLRAALSSFLLMAANPFIIVSFLAVFAAFGFETSGIGDLRATWLFAGLYLGSASWWLIFASAATWFRRHIQNGGVSAINIGAGALMFAFGLWQIGQLLAAGLR